MIDLNKVMYDVLIVGMILSSVVYLLGLMLLFVQNPNLVQATLLHYQNLREFLQELLLFRSSAVLMLATVILLATPISRVFVSILVFAANRDRKFAAITGTVFIVLVLSMALGYFGRFTPQ